MALIVLLDFTVIKNQYQTSFNASLIDKAERMESIDKPKIILAGDSNVAFGFDSALIEKELGMPVVNMGLHAALGNVFLERAGTLYVNSGDIVVICSSSYDDDNTIKDTGMALKTLEHHKNLWQIPRKEDYFGLATAYPNYIAESVACWISHTGNKAYDDPYSRYSFNDYGDIVDRPEGKKLDPDEMFAKTPMVKPKLSDQCAQRLNALNDELKEKGAVLLVAGYPIGDGEYT